MSGHTRRHPVKLDLFFGINTFKQVTLILNLVVKPNYTRPTDQLQLLLSVAQLSPTLFMCFDSRSRQGQGKFMAKSRKGQGEVHAR